MATSVDRSQLQVVSITFGKVLVALWLAQLVHGEPNPACKTVPEFMKAESEEKCCEMPQVFLNETVKECWSKVEGSGKSQVEQSCEFSACVFKQDKFTKSDGRVDSDRLRTFIKESLQASSEWKSLLEKVVLEECMPMIEKDAAAIQKLTKSDCDPTPAFLIACAASKSYAKCPTSSWTGSKACDEWKSYFTKCANTVDDLGEMFKQVESRKLAENQN
ncbi:general odorant-binding protein 66-like [Anopheles ziemanni]|uniref:general odorant-binding protein 66-like n=1 Tax=Anopheles coustani TaxID=139045 RepID=UPI00265B1B35|nr:general odorant-binding protein 66-like [Anopheles coustani]XP_058178304.1 general odorant-binding protein 66-like [Anopheles ziemanni]